MKNIAIVLIAALLCLMGFGLSGAAEAQQPPLQKPAKQRCANPDAIGMSRVVEIDTTGGPGFGLEQYKAHDFLLPNEVVLTFDDGPWPENTRSVLAALEAHCVKATFFPIGKHALYHPEILKEVLAAGHTVGSHTWSHMNLGKATPEAARDEIEKGFSAVRLALGGKAPAPFFRFPALQAPQTAMDYLAQRNIGIFSMDVDSFDFKWRKPELVAKVVMEKLEKKGKGILLMHDFQQATAKGLPELLAQLKAKGYKVVHLTAKVPATTLANYDEDVAKTKEGATVGSGRPTSSVVKTITPDP